MSGCPAVGLTGLAWWRRGMLFHPIIVDRSADSLACGWATLLNRRLCGRIGARRLRPAAPCSPAAVGSPHAGIDGFSSRAAGTDLGGGRVKNLAADAAVVDLSE